MTTDALVDEALALPLTEWSYVAERLLRSLDNDRPLSDEGREEIARRVARRLRGESGTFSRDTVRAYVSAVLSRCAWPYIEEAWEELLLAVA